MSVDGLWQIDADIRAGLERIARIDDGAVQDVLRIAFSDAITRKIGMRFLGTGVGRFALKRSASSLLATFAKRLARMERTAAARELIETQFPAHPAISIVGAGDARRLPLPDGMIDVIVTSPPYLPASSGRENYAKSKAPSLLALALATNDQIERLRTLER